MKWQFGLSLKKENYSKFKKEIEQIAIEQDIKSIVRNIKIDEELDIKNINIETLKELEKLQPFGEKNKPPIFIYKNLKINSIRALSEGKHLKLILRDGNSMIDAIGFNLGNLVQNYSIGDKIDIVGILEINEFKEKEIIQINILDIMKSV